VYEIFEGKILVGKKPKIRKKDLRYYGIEEEVNKMEKWGFVKRSLLGNYKMTENGKVNFIKKVKKNYNIGRSQSTLMEISNSNNIRERRRDLLEEYQFFKKNRCLQRRPVMR